VGIEGQADGRDGPATGVEVEVKVKQLIGLAKRLQPTQYFVPNVCYVDLTRCHGYCSIKDKTIWDRLEKPSRSHYLRLIHRHHLNQLFLQ
jgi:hypothetical protein